MKIKPILLITIPILALFTALALGSMISSNADNTEFITDGSVLTRYSGQNSSVVVPEGITKIGENAFADNSFIVSVELPDSLESIGYRAFAGCINLKGVSIPDSVRTIEDSAFNGDYNLENVKIGNGLEKLGAGVFAGCKSLSNIDLVNSNFICIDSSVYDSKMKTLYQYLAGGRANVYDMPDSVEEVKRYTFWGCDNLEEIHFSTGLKSIGEYAAANCTGLKNVVIYTPTRSIGLGAFENDSAIRQIVAPVSVGNIHSEAFYNCPTDMIFVCEPSGYVEKYALSNGYLTSNSVQYTVKKKEVNIDDRVDDVQTTGDNDDESSSDVVDRREENYVHTSVPADIQDGQLVSDTIVVSDRAFISLAGLESEELSLDSEVSPAPGSYYIGDYSHYNDAIESFTIPSEISYIGKLSFARSDLNSIIIPDGVTAIDYAAFYHCDNLSEVVIPESVTFIGEHAFEYTPWYEEWLLDDSSSDFLIVGDGILIGYKGNDENPSIPEDVKKIADGVFTN